MKIKYTIIKFDVKFSRYLDLYTQGQKLTIFKSSFNKTYREQLKLVKMLRVVFETSYYWECRK